MPYFKYLLEVCTRYLTDNQDECSINSIRKRKKAKVLGADSNKETKGDLSPSQWHLRALILLSLHKCFLYDSGSTKFLDSSNFQASLFFSIFKTRNSLCCILQNWKLKYDGFMQKMRRIFSIDTMQWNFGGSEKESFYLLLFFTNGDLKGNL